jgi:hypothetical protein
MYVLHLAFAYLAYVNPVWVHGLDLVGDNPSTSFPLGMCQGDCDDNDQCFGDLICSERTDTRPIPGCSGTGQYGKDYCYNPNLSTVLAVVANKKKHPTLYPLGECEGECNTDADCSGSLLCFQPSDTETVPGCTETSGTPEVGFCYRDEAVMGGTPNSGTTSSIRRTAGAQVTYKPGLLTVSKAGLKLSAGLDVRIIAIKDKPVQYANGGQSAINFHTAPDAAAVFPKKDGSGNYYYVSNAESTSAGGAGSIEFDSNGKVLGYQRVLSGTQRNCGGGRSPYNTWLSGEENGSKGFVWEVSPGGKFVGRKTNLVPVGGNYESVAFGFDTTIGRNVYFTTEDSATGPVVQFIPSANLGTREEMYSAGTHKFLRVDNGNVGTFSWVATKSNATPERYPNAEGIDVKNGYLYFVSKVDKTLFILNLAAGTFTRESTNQGAVRKNA